LTAADAEPVSVVDSSAATAASRASTARRVRGMDPPEKLGVHVDVDIWA
jgi:hypothetical protein